MADTPAVLVAARTRMALSLGWHIVIACFGVGMPAITVPSEWRALRSMELPMALHHRAGACEPTT